LVAGSGGVGKTGIWIRALEMGGKLFGDDLVLLDSSGILHPFPLAHRTLSFRFAHRNASDDLSWPDRLRWLFHGASPGSPPVAAPARVDRLVVLTRESIPSHSAEGEESPAAFPENRNDFGSGIRRLQYESEAELADSLWANLRMEFFGAPLESALWMREYAFPDGRTKEIESAYRETLARIFPRKTWE
jgi:hypothetical protein